MSEAVAHAEGRTRALTQLLTNSTITSQLSQITQAMVLLLLGAILAQVPWAAELYKPYYFLFFCYFNSTFRVITMEVEAIVKYISSTDLTTSSCATYMAAMLLAQLNTREKDSPSPFAAKLIRSIRIITTCFVLLTPSELLSFDMPKLLKVYESYLLHKARAVINNSHRYC